MKLNSSLINNKKPMTSPNALANLFVDELDEMELVVAGLSLLLREEVDRSAFEGNKLVK
jgi:hypothetical protein